MKLNHLLSAAAAFALVGGAAYAQESTTSATMPAQGSASGQVNSDAHTGMTTSSSEADAAASVSTDASTTSMAGGATLTTTTVTNGPVPDTAENRARFGGPMSRAGQRTSAAGN
jgi:hypothetical protein